MSSKRYYGTITRGLMRRNLDHELARRAPSRELPEGDPCAFCGKIGTWPTMYIPGDEEVLVCPNERCQEGYEDTKESAMHEWVELYDERNDVVLGRGGRIVACRWESRDKGYEKIGDPIFWLEGVPDLVNAAYQVAKIYNVPHTEPTELKVAIEKLTEILEAANYVVKENL